MSYLYAAFMSVPGFPFTPIKVGFTTNPTARTNDYRYGPFPITMIGFWEGTREDEKAFHREFRNDRIKGEWFIPTEDLMEVIQGNMMMGDMLNSTSSLSAGELQAIFQDSPRSVEEFLELGGSVLSGVTP